MSNILINITNPNGNLINVLVFILLLSLIISYTQKAQTSVAYSQSEAFALPTQSNKQQETYAGMKTRYTLRQAQHGYNHTHRHLLITLILTVFEKLRSFLIVKRKASINAIQYVRNLPLERPKRNTFRRTYFPSA